MFGDIDSFSHNYGWKWNMRENCVLLFELYILLGCPKRQLGKWLVNGL